MLSKWDQRFIELTDTIANWSRDPSTKCGAVVVRPDKTIASVGFNGFPRGTKDDVSLYLNRALKLERIIHAEVNAILNAKEVLSGYTMYSFPSCANCSACIIQSGIKRIVFTRLFKDLPDRWLASVSIGLDMFDEAGVEVVLS